MLLLFATAHAQSPTPTHLRGQTAAVKQTPQYSHAPELVPIEQTAGMSRAYVECLIFELAAKLTHCCTYLCAPVKHVYYRRPLSDYICCRESRESQPRRASCCRSSLPCSHTHIKTHTRTQLTLCLYKDMGAGHPSLTEKKDNKDEIQVRSHPKTCRQGLACERRPLQRWGYFWSCEGFTQSIYITGMPLVSALKRVLLLKEDTLILNRWAKPSSCQF